MDQPVRVRFAPSPTGYLHVGGLRTALYNYLFARKNGGKFILRIEDTDRTRFVEGAVENLLNTLAWAGLEYDEGPGKDGGCGPYVQSERTELYRQHAQQLLNNGYAYPCFCTSERLDDLRLRQQAAKMPPGYDKKCLGLSAEERQQRMEAGEPYVIRLNVPKEGNLVFDDVIRGRVRINYAEIDDQVLIKSDGFPTYHLANVVDDHYMGVTHVIRGEEWLPSTPKHIMLYDCFGWQKPVFAHLPLLLNPDRSKLSKRQADVAAEDYKQKGYLPQALVNFVALLGWNRGDNQELFTLEELCRDFSLERVGKAGAVFDITKLNWMNGMYIRGMDIEDLAQLAAPCFADWDLSDRPMFLKALNVARDHAVVLDDLPQYTKPYYQRPVFTPEQCTDFAAESTRNLLCWWDKALAGLHEPTYEQLEELTTRGVAETGLKGRAYYFPLRLALYGNTSGPHIPQLIDIMGVDESRARLQAALSVKGE